MDIKKWIETNTGLKTKHIHWLKPPKYPYCAIFDDITSDGADLAISLIMRHDVTIELYSNDIDVISEQKLESLFIKENIDFQKDRMFVASEKHYQTVYDFTILERKD